MRKTPLVSVLLPAFNEASCIVAAVKSIREQTYGNWELIVVDNNSTDDTASLALSTGDARVRVISERTSGIVHALNTGLSHARGDLIARQDADDFSSSRRFEAQVSFLESHPEVAIVGSDAWLSVEGREGSTVLRMPHHNWTITCYKYFRNPFIHTSVMIRKEVIRATGGYRLNCEWQDYDLWLRVLDEYPGANIAEPLVSRVIRSNSTWRIDQQASIEHDLAVLRANKDCLRSRIGRLLGEGYHRLRLARTKLKRVSVVD